MEIVYSIGTVLNGGGIGNTAYYEAEGFYRNKALKKVLSYKYNKAKIPKKFIKTNESLYLLDLTLGFTKNRIYSKLPHYSITTELFDKWASKQIKKGDLFYGWTGMSLRQIEVAKKNKMVTVLECASSHPEYQKEIIEEEYKIWNVNTKVGEERVYNRALKEVKKVDYIKIPSRFVKESFIEKGVDEDKLIEVPFGVDLNRFSQKKEFNKEGITAVFVGSVGFRKGILYLLKAWEKIKIKRKKLYVVGAVLPEIKKFIREYRKRKDIVFTGHTDPRPYFYKSDLFIFPSIEEGSALATYEAMAVGIPQIVTYNSGSIIRDGKEGFIIPIRDPKAIIEKVEYFYENKNEIKRMGKNARKLVEKYSWENYGDKLYKKIKRIV